MSHGYGAAEASEIYRNSEPLDAGTVVDESAAFESGDSNSDVGGSSEALDEFGDLGDMDDIGEAVEHVRQRIKETSDVVAARRMLDELAGEADSGGGEIQKELRSLRRELRSESQQKPVLDGESDDVAAIAQLAAEGDVDSETVQTLAGMAGVDTPETVRERYRLKRQERKYDRRLEMLDTAFERLEGVIASSGGALVGNVFESVFSGDSGPEPRREPHREPPRGPPRERPRERPQSAERRLSTEPPREPPASGRGDESGAHGDAEKSTSRERFEELKEAAEATSGDDETGDATDETDGTDETTGGEADDAA